MRNLDEWVATQMEWRRKMAERMERSREIVEAERGLE